jgi:hypothetical protein
MATFGARKTPRGARPNRRGGLARPVCVAFAALRPSGRLLESRSDPGPRGMIAAPRFAQLDANRMGAAQRTESGLQAHPLIDSCCAAMSKGISRLMWTAVAVLGLATAAKCAGPVVYQPTQAQVQHLKVFLRHYLGPPYAAFEDGEPTQFAAVFVDLSAGHSREVIVYLWGRGWCGTGGCVALVLAPSGTSYRVVTKITNARLPIRVLITRSHGWRDITVIVAGGGIMQPHEAKLSFNGRTYPRNPSVAPARELTEGVPGVVAIPSSVLVEKGERLYQ